MSLPSERPTLTLRKHPMWAIPGNSYWPPLWIHTRGKVVQEARGEIGVLTQVRPADSIAPNQFFLSIEHDGERYIGCVVLHNPMVCRRLCEFLSGHIGKSIKEIGDLDLSSLPRPHWPSFNAKKGRGGE